MAIVTVERSADTPITLSDARVQCMIDEDIVDEDSLIEGLIIAAVDFCERYTNRTLIAQKQKYVGVLSPCIELLPNLLSVNTMTYRDEGNQLKTLNANNYYVDTTSMVGNVSPTGDWPAVKSDHPQPVIIEFTSGYGHSEDVPGSIKQCILMLVGYWFRNRDALGSAPSALEYAVFSLLGPYTVHQV